MFIIKRDGRKVQFNKQKIVEAVLRAYLAVDGEVTSHAEEKAHNIADYIEKTVATKGTLTVEEIQDLVENGLMSGKRKDVARAYISYRNERTRVRERKSQIRKAVKEKMSAKNVQNQNANVDEKSFGGRMGEANSEVMRQLALDEYVSPRSRYNHINNRVYIHDLDHWVAGDHNCLTIPFDHLLANGFNTRQTDIRPAGSVDTAFQLVAVIFQLQSLQQFGGVSASHIDWTMVPYVRKSFAKHYRKGLKYISVITDSTIDYEIEYMLKNTVDYSIEDNEYESYDQRAYVYAIDMLEAECKQAAEAMYHNLNSLQSRSGNQLPFTSLNYGTCILPEGRMVIRALLEGSLAGVGKLHRTPIFPCGIFQLAKGINREPGSPNYDLYRLALESTSRRLYPNYANIDWSGNAGYDKNDPRTYFSTMGCRTANGWDINGLGQLKDGRGNICPVTIILPTIAMEAKAANTDDIMSTFLELLDDVIHDAKDTLIERFDWICEQDSEAARFMYENGLMAGYIPEEGIYSALKHGTLAIGQLGLAEALQILVGCDHTEEKGMAAAHRIEALFKKRCADFKEEYKLNFGVYFTPAENLCHTAVKRFRNKYGTIPNISENDFFTNSMHVPVWKQMSPFQKIDIESQLTGYSSAGCITYIELDGSVRHNIDALETIVNYAMDKDIPYFAVNVPNDTCLECGFSDEFNDECPACHSDHIQQLRRVTGYLTGNYTTAFNKGKQQEVKKRVKHI